MSTLPIILDYIWSASKVQHVLSIVAGTFISCQESTSFVILMRSLKFQSMKTHMIYSGCQVEFQIGIKSTNVVQVRPNEHLCPVWLLVHFVQWFQRDDWRLPATEGRRTQSDDPKMEYIWGVEIYYKSCRFLEARWGFHVRHNKIEWANRFLQIANSFYKHQQPWCPIWWVV